MLVEVGVAQVHLNAGCHHNARSKYIAFFSWRTTTTRKRFHFETIPGVRAMKSMARMLMISVSELTQPDSFICVTSTRYRASFACPSSSSIVLMGNNPKLPYASRPNLTHARSILLSSSHCFWSTVPSSVNSRALPLVRWWRTIPLSPAVFA